MKVSMNAAVSGFRLQTALKNPGSPQNTSRKSGQWLKRAALLLRWNHNNHFDSVFNLIRFTGCGNTII